MVNWKFWQRKNTTGDADLPEEVREYYETTQRSGRSSAILLGLLTLVVTLVLAAALYFAGRFIYDRFFANEPNTPETSQNETNNESNDESATERPNENNQTDRQDSNQQNEENDSPTTLPGDNNEDESAEQTESNQGTSSTSTDQPVALSETPNTGPGDVVAIFVGTSLLAGLGFEVFARKKQS